MDQVLLILLGSNGSIQTITITIETINFTLVKVDSINKHSKLDENITFRHTTNTRGSRIKNSLANESNKL